LAYDINTVTAGDYTVEMNISTNMYKSFLSNQFEEVKDEKDEHGNPKWSRALYLKKYLTDEVATVLNQYQKDRKEADPHHDGE